MGKPEKQGVSGKTCSDLARPLSLGQAGEKVTLNQVVMGQKTILLKGAVLQIQEHFGCDAVRVCNELMNKPSHYGIMAKPINDELLN